MKSLIKQNQGLTKEISSASVPSSSPTNAPDPRRWKALALLSLAQFIVILDTSIIGIALPTIQQHFDFSQTDLQWVFNAYVIVFGASLLLGGRLSDILGHNRIFVVGFVVLTLASILAGLAPSGLILILTRALQGIGAALIAPSALSMVMSFFGHNKFEMNKAMGIWGAAAPAGGTAGVFLGGVITAWLDWPWVFLINVPVGIAVLVLVRITLPRGIKKQKGRVDYLGSIFITAALVLLVYAIVTANDVGWMSMQTVPLMSIAAIMFGIFFAIQRHKKDPLIPLRIFKTRNLLGANIVMALLGAAWIPMWFFLNLYLQQIIGYGPFESGLALLPMTVTIMLLMVLFMPRLTKRFGFKRNMVIGLVSLTISIVLFSGLPSVGDNSKNQIFTSYMLPISLVAALGMSLSYIPVLTAAISNARKEETGLASGLVNTSYQIGSALGLAIMVGLASGQTETLQNIGVGQVNALNGGFQLAFIGAALVSAAAVILSVVSIRRSPPAPSQRKENL
jgi:EmrB/QacA subfamily drug resistance transporter